MSRTLHPEERRLWSMVLATVRPAPGRVAPTEFARALDAKAAPVAVPPVRERDRLTHALKTPPQDIEPGRKRRIARGRDSLEARIDLHGLDQDHAKAVLLGFLTRAQADGYRAALVITGKGVQGDGILRRRAPEWLSDPTMRHVVAGFSPAAQHHGGDGALYVAIKRRVG